MTETELRNKVAKSARTFLGVKEGSAMHRRIVDTYNSHKPLARNYALKYTDAWCAGFVGAVAVLCGLTDIIPMEVSVQKMLDIAKTKGIWVENDAYVPQTGDLIIYAWSDTGAGDCSTGANHVGIVESVSGGNIKVIEGNLSDAVGRRSISLNGRYIRGFICPDYAAAAGFEDVPDDAWYASAVRWAKVNGIVEGVDGTHFAPDKPCTRAQAVTMLWRLSGSTEGVCKLPFEDVPGGAYYAKAVRWAYRGGIIKGIAEDAFGPDEPCTRAQIVTMLWRADGQPEGVFVYTPFDDVKPSAYYADAVAWAYSEGITFGTSGNTFAPDAACTRAEIVAFLYRYAG